jgi:transposase
MKLQGLELLQWPAQSLVLNPIENIWKVLKDSVRRRLPYPRTREELKVVLVEEWTRNYLRASRTACPRESLRLSRIKGTRVVTRFTLFFGSN